MARREPCIQPTYEELKPSVRRCCRQGIQGIQPTYEELKPAPGMRLGIPYSTVSSLPMRN